MRSLFLLRLRYKLLQWGGRADARPTEFAATVLTAERHSASEATAPAPLDEAPAANGVSQIGRYLIKGRLGTGGLGEVFEAWDPLLSRQLAVKTVRLQLDPDLRALLGNQILKEARTAAGLSHPNIVTVFDAGLCTPGVYIAMERLHGRDLRQALARGWRPTPWQAVQLARRVADALAYAHDKGVVHCDIKPANIFLGADDRPKVLDFGIARMAHDPQLPGGDGPLFGSPHYLAPEQLQQGAADARTDIRALGVVLYEMLTGRKAFAGESVEEVVNAVLLNHPAPAHELRSGVPRALSAIAAKAMSLEPERRYERAEDMAAELRDWCDRNPEPADDANSPARRPPVRAKAPVGWALAGVALCLATAGWLWWLSSVRPGPVQTASKAQPAVAGAAGAAAVRGQPQPSAPDRAGAAIAAARSRPDGAANSGPETAVADGPAGVEKSRGAAATKRPSPRAETAKPGASRKPAADTATGSGAVLLSISPWGAIEVNGQPAGTTPPLSRLSLPAGRHTITVRNEDFPSFTTTVTVQADKPALVRHRFVQ